MTPDTIPQSVLFPDLFDKPLVATFNQEHASSDGGAVLLKAAERVYGLVKAFARCLADKRAPGKIRHTLADLIGRSSSRRTAAAATPVAETASDATPTRKRRPMTAKEKEAVSERMKASWAARRKKAAK